MNIEDALRQVPLFSELSRRSLKRLGRGARTSHFAKGDTILRQDETATALFVIVSGRVEVTTQVEGSQERPVGTLGPGDFFGEMALIDDLPRSASVRAVEDTECLELWRYDFRFELRKSPSIAAEMLPAINRRLRQTDAQLST